MQKYIEKYTCFFYSISLNKTIKRINNFLLLYVLHSWQRVPNPLFFKDSSYITSPFFNFFPIFPTVPLFL